MRRDEDGKVLADQHSMRHVFGRDAVLLADADRKRQEAEEIRTRAEHHTDRHGEYSHDDMEVRPEESRDDHDERLGHRLEHLAARQYAEEHA